MLPESTDLIRTTDEIQNLVRDIYTDIVECFIVDANNPESASQLKDAVWKTVSSMTYKLVYPPEEGLLVGRKVKSNMRA